MRKFIILFLGLFLVGINFSFANQIKDDPPEPPVQTCKVKVVPLWWNWRWCPRDLVVVEVRESRRPYAIQVLCAEVVVQCPVKTEDP